MSNYHVEPADKPQALTKEALKSLRHEQVQGISRRELLRGSLGRRRRPVAARRSPPAPSASCGRTSRAGSAARSRSARSTTSRPPTRSLPIDQGFPAYYPTARAFVILVDTTQQRFIEGADSDRRRHLGQRARPLPALPAPRLQARTRASRTSGSSAPATARATTGSGSRRSGRSTVRRRGAWTASRTTVDSDGVLTIDTGKITLGPLPIAVGQPGIIPPRTPTGLHLTVP